MEKFFFLKAIDSIECINTLDIGYGPIELPLSGVGGQTQERKEPPVESKCPSIWEITKQIQDFLAKEALGTGYKEFPDTLSNQAWRIIPKEGLSEAASIEVFKKAGWKSFFNGNPVHFGGSDYEKYHNGAWYHVTIGYGRKTYSYDKGTFSMKDSSQPPPWITIHCETGFRPSSHEHFRDFMNKNIGIDVNYLRYIWIR